MGFIGGSSILFLTETTKEGPMPKMQILVVGDPCLDEDRAKAFAADLQLARNTSGRAKLYIIGRPFVSSMPQNRIEHFLDLYRKFADLILVGRLAQEWVRDLPQWADTPKDVWVEGPFSSSYHLTVDPVYKATMDLPENTVCLHISPDFPDTSSYVNVDHRQWEPYTYGPGLLLAIYPLGVYARQMALGDYVA